MALQAPCRAVRRAFAPLTITPFSTTPLPSPIIQPKGFRLCVQGGAIQRSNRNLPKINAYLRLYVASVLRLYVAKREKFLATYTSKKGTDSARKVGAIMRKRGVIQRTKGGVIMRSERVAIMRTKASQK